MRSARLRADRQLFPSCSSLSPDPMQIQPLLLTFPVSLPGAAPTRSTGAVQAGASCKDCGDTKPTQDDSATAETDAVRLEISSAAQTAATAALSPAEQKQVTELKERDSEVRTHEQAHLAAAGPHARGGPTYTYPRGPDGQQYAIGGEVQIDTSPVAGDPEATLDKARQIRAAAGAPSDPSSQDQQVAAAASQLESQARAELQQQENSGTAAGSTAPTSAAAASAGRSAASSASFYNQLIQAAYRTTATPRGFNALA